MRQAAAAGSQDLSDDLRFHQLLLRASGNRLLAQMIKLLCALLRAGFELLGRRPAVTNGSLPWHAAVLEAVTARDADRAERAMAALIDAVAEDLGRMLGGPRQAIPA